MKIKLPILSLVLLLSISSIYALDLSTAITQSEEALKGSTASSAGFIQEGDEDTIVKSLHDKGITIHENRENFKPNQDIRRDEAAKMLTLAIPYISNPQNLKAINTSCSFKDSDKAWPDLKDILVDSCEKGLFKGSNGYFNPQNSITNGQILTVLGRMLYGLQDESIGHYATKYVSLLEDDGYLENLSIPYADRDKPAARGTLAKLLIRVLG